MKFTCTAEWTAKTDTLEAGTPHEAAELFAEFNYDPDDHDSQDDESLDVNVVNEDGEEETIVVYITTEYSFHAEI